MKHGHAEPPGFVAHQHHGHPPHAHMGKGGAGAQVANPTGQPMHGAIVPPSHMTGPVAPPWALKGLATSPYAAFASRNDPNMGMDPGMPGGGGQGAPGPQTPEVPPWAMGGR